MTTTVGSILAALLTGALYTAVVLRRNRHLVRPPILRGDGTPAPGLMFAFSDGETVDYVDVGPTDDPASGHGPASTGPALFLVPGADGMKETFRYQVPALARCHRVICASLRERFAPEDTLERMVDDVAELASASGVEDLVLVGQSLGGPIAMRFAVRFPERVAGLVLTNTLARIGYEHVGLNRALLTPIAMFTTRYLPTALGRAMARVWSRLDVWIYDSSPGGERVIDYALWTGPRTVPSSVSRARVARLKKVDLRPQLPSIRAPTLVLKGPRDHYVPPAWSHEIASLVPGARYEEVPGTGHCSHVSMPGSFNRRLSRWLEAVARREAGAGASEGPNSSGATRSRRLESEVCE